MFRASRLLIVCVWRGMGMDTEHSKFSENSRYGTKSVHNIFERIKPKLNKSNQCCWLSVNILCQTHTFIRGFTLRKRVYHMKVRKCSYNKSDTFHPLLHTEQLTQCSCHQTVIEYTLLASTSLCSPPEGTVKKEVIRHTKEYP